MSDTESLDESMAEAGTFSVAELADAINLSLRHGLGAGVWVRGEIQGFNGRGTHAYFRLVDDTDGVKASIDVAWFAFQRSKLRPVLARAGLELADGIKVRIFGAIDFYAPSGRLSLKMSDVDTRHTLGELALGREALVRRLRDSGRYDANRHRILPPVPLAVGVVTSIGSAAWHDFTAEITRSELGFRLVAADARVQGDEAPVMVSAALDQLAARGDLDAVVLIRGGGSKTDLAAFDTEVIADAIARCPLPVFTGIGHEIDVSVADEVAHRSFKTPTAVAVGLVEQVRSFVDSSENTWARIAQRAGALLDVADARVVARREELARRPIKALDAADRHLASLEAQMRAHDPVRVMARGWSITRDAQGVIVTSTDQIAPGGQVTTSLASGSFTSTVEEVT